MHADESDMQTEHPRDITLASVCEREKGRERKQERYVEKANTQAVPGTAASGAYAAMIEMVIEATNDTMLNGLVPVTT
jgi:hypothetical protein